MKARNVVKARLALLSVWLLGGLEGCQLAGGLALTGAVHHRLGRGGTGRNQAATNTRYNLMLSSTD